MRTFFFYWLLPFSALTFLLRVEHANYCLGLTLKCLELGIRVPDSLVLRKHIFSPINNFFVEKCLFFFHPSKEKTPSVGDVSLFWVNLHLLAAVPIKYWVKKTFLEIVDKDDEEEILKQIFYFIFFLKRFYLVFSLQIFEMIKRLSIEKVSFNHRFSPIKSVWLYGEVSPFWECFPVPGFIISGFVCALSVSLLRKRWTHTHCTVYTTGN